MPIKPINRLLFEQGGLCFFCQQKLAPSDATIEHLVAKSNGGDNSDENIVACCKELNSLMGRKGLKEKLRVILNQKDGFKCPNGVSEPKTSIALPEGAIERVVTDLRKGGAARPRTVKTLTNSINNLFPKGLSAQQMGAILSQLNASGVIAVNGAKVSYGHRNI